MGGYKGCNAKLFLVTRASRFRDSDIASPISFNSPEVPGLPKCGDTTVPSDVEIPAIEMEAVEEL